MHKSTMLFSSCLVTIVFSIVSAQPMKNVESSNAGPQMSRIRKRSYPWYSEQSNYLSLYNAGNVFTPAPYTIPRPYYIPVYGTSGGHRIYYPPQRIYLTPGSPPDNPVRPFQGPSYLPPRPITPPKETPPKIPEVEKRFGDDDEDDAPIWGKVAMGHMPLSDDKESAPMNRPTDKEFAPTRPSITKPPSPPLIHDINVPQTGSNTRAETTPLTSSGPNNCIWAIISCCSGSNPSLVPQNCFEQRGCPGPFWGRSPCEPEYAQAAIAAAQNYYKN